RRVPRAGEQGDRELRAARLDRAVGAPLPHHRPRAAGTPGTLTGTGRSPAGSPAGSRRAGAGALRAEPAAVRPHPPTEPTPSPRAFFGQNRPVRSHIRP